MKANELVVNSTNEVWRSNSPIEFNGSFKNVLAGGVKCGPRSSWSVMICHTFGKPAIGAGKPGHACVAYKTASPMEKPHPGSAWKIGYGRGWEYPKLEGMSIKVAAAYVDQVFHIPSGTSEPVTLKIPWSKGLWDTTPMVDIKLERGPQILRISAPLQRATAVHRVELKSK